MGIATEESSPKALSRRRRIRGKWLQISCGPQDRECSGGLHGQNCARTHALIE